MKWLLILLINWIFQDLPNAFKISVLLATSVIILAGSIYDSVKSPQEE